jgi:hypothetical protein
MSETIVPKYVAKFGQELMATPTNPLAWASVITIDELPWVGFQADGADEPSPYVFTKTLMDPESGNFCMVVRIEPGGGESPHWHKSDTVYIIRKGEMTVPGEGTYREGDFRWVRGGYAYGGELPGPDGVEFFFLSMGPYGWFNPDVDEPPLGRWDQSSS